eukprot:TRINITY_DN3112_c0_g1_i1.p1 TRINITY_DN3112_c0_g1~~TRINITY_DN3112_c0_g1_i1.p1  ORF type:complete len:154 (-),score=33.08 TRINITY_DN3112_c0_g1_i1:28-420(-)
MNIHNLSDHKRKYQNDIPHDRIEHLSKQINTVNITQNRNYQHLQQQQQQQQASKAQQNPFQTIPIATAARAAATTPYTMNLHSLLPQFTAITSVPNTNAFNTISPTRATDNATLYEYNESNGTGCNECNI